MTEEQKQPVFQVEKLYVKDFSFESPNAPQSFLATEAPQVEVSLSTQGQPVQEGLVEAVLSITVKALGKEDKVAFLAEVQQAGLFRLENIPEAHMPHLLGVHCPTILFPFAREAVAEMVGRGGFVPFYLQPINFDALFQQSQQQQAAQNNQQPAPQVTQ